MASTAEQQAIALDREEVRQEGKSVGSQEVSIMTSPLFNIRVHLLGWKCPKNVRSVFNFSSQTCCTFFFAQFLYYSVVVQSSAEQSLYFQMSLPKRRAAKIV